MVGWGLGGTLKVGVVDTEGRSVGWWELVGLSVGLDEIILGRWEADVGILL